MLEEGVGHEPNPTQFRSESLRGTMVVRKRAKNHQQNTALVSAHRGSLHDLVQSELTELFGIPLSGVEQKFGRPSHPTWQTSSEPQMSAGTRSGMADSLRLASTRFACSISVAHCGSYAMTAGLRRRFSSSQGTRPARVASCAKCHAAHMERRMAGTRDRGHDPTRDLESHTGGRRADDAA